MNEKLIILSNKLCLFQRENVQMKQNRGMNVLLAAPSTAFSGHHKMTPPQNSSPQGSISFYSPSSQNNSNIPKAKLIAPISQNQFFCISQENQLYHGKITSYTSDAKMMHVEYMGIYDFGKNHRMVHMKWSQRNHLAADEEEKQQNSSSKKAIGASDSSSPEAKYLACVDEEGKCFVFTRKVLLESISASLARGDGDSQEPGKEPQKKRRRLSSPIEPLIQFSLQHEAKEPGCASVSVWEESWNQSKEADASILVAVSRQFSRDAHVYTISTSVSQKQEPTLLKYIPTRHLANKVLLFPPKSSSLVPQLAILSFDTVYIWDLEKQKQVSYYRPTTSGQPLYDISYLTRKGAQKPSILATVGEDRCVALADAVALSSLGSWKNCTKYAPGAMFFSTQRADICFVAGRDSEELKVANYVTTKRVKRNTSIFATTRWSHMEYCCNMHTDNEYLFGCTEMGDVYRIENPYAVSKS